MATSSNCTAYPHGREGHCGADSHERKDCCGRGPVFVMTGLLGDSASMVLDFPKQSLGEQCVVGMEKKRSLCFQFRSRWGNHYARHEFLAKTL
ncbi:hypothetical protein HPB48_007855 [Haemaphysalis longicornis]|uniref:Uncharacterized protein n=1 Tax=Haemaphysalis longicornis TaxID=44386 RepID=A0A9J6GI98_HAELO|nr:hypothetical protein HPB48_007855 [Haemaphysalis longicornis]